MVEPDVGDVIGKPVARRRPSAGERYAQAHPNTTGAGRISAIDRPPRVTMTDSPASITSRSSDNIQDASVAMMVRTFLGLSDYQMAGQE